jgi:hypothetical protein
MIERTFDARALARMNLALDRVCRTIVDGETHPIRKRVARRIIKCARSGRTGVEELTAAGHRAIARLARSDRPRSSDSSVSPPDERRSCPSHPGSGITWREPRQLAEPAVPLTLGVPETGADAEHADGRTVAPEAPFSPA